MTTLTPLLLTAPGGGPRFLAGPAGLLPLAEGSLRLRRVAVSKPWAMAELASEVQADGRVAARFRGTSTQGDQNLFVVEDYAELLGTEHGCPGCAFADVAMQQVMARARMLYPPKGEESEEDWAAKAESFTYPLFALLLSEPLFYKLFAYDPDCDGLCSTFDMTERWAAGVPRYEP